MTEQQAEQAESDFPQAWRPDPGDRITGTVVGVTMSPDFGYGPYPIVTVTTADGAERAIHAMHYALRTELARRRPSRGDELDITYQGKRATKGDPQRSFHAYRVAGGKEPEFNWDSELPEDEREARQRAVQQAVPIAPSPTPSEQQPFPEPEPGSQFGTDPPF